MKRHIFLLYGIVCYALFFISFLYAIGFLGNFIVPKSIDSGEAGPLGVAIVVNLFLLGLFAIQHSVMARPAFKAQWTKIIEKPIERSTYVIASSLCLFILYLFWQPMPQVIWSFESGPLFYLLWALFAFGWGLVLVATFLIDHFDLFGLRQVWLYWSGRDYTPKTFKQPGPYKWVRHPLYVGWFFAFWSTPHMTYGHLLFAIGTAGYILIAIQLEERDLIAHLGEPYRKYREQVPMLIPFLRKKPKPETPEAPREPRQST